MCIRDRSRTAPGMTATKSTCRQAAPAEHAVGLDRFQRVLGTGGFVAATEAERAKNRGQDGRHDTLIGAKQKFENDPNRIHGRVELESWPAAPEPCEGGRRNPARCNAVR